MHLGLEGKKALVCGASSGIGFAIAQALYEEGCHVTLCARSEEKLKSACQLIEATQTSSQVSKNLNQELSNGDNDGENQNLSLKTVVDYLVADFSDPKQVGERLKSYLLHQKGFDIVINNTGGPAPGPAELATCEQFEAAFRQHLLCNQVIAQLVIPMMKQKTFGRIINIISTSVKQPIENLGVSNAIRGAVANWSKTLASELGPYGITVNNILPGATQTGRLTQIIERKASAKSVSNEEMSAEEKKTIPARRFGEPHEIASAAVFLASVRASYITGTNLTVDGGRTACL